jgi:hypothetical protein
VTTAAAMRKNTASRRQRDPASVIWRAADGSAESDSSTI